MSLIQHRFFPRSMFDMDYWLRPEALGFGPSTLDLFDPFDLLDNQISRNLLWIDRPAYLEALLAPPQVPKVASKYRISVDCSGFNPQSIKTQISDDKKKLIVTGKEGEAKEGDEDYSVKEFKRTYKLPENAETDKLVSFVTSEGMLVIEIPIKRPENNNNNQKLNVKDEGSLKIVDGENGKKSLKLNFSLPESVDASKVKVTCKDRDLIVQAEDKVEKPDGVSQLYFYRRTTLPDNTDFDSLKCVYHENENRLTIEAPINTEFKKSNRSVPIEMKQGAELENKLESVKPREEKN